MAVKNRLGTSLLLAGGLVVFGVFAYSFSLGRVGRFSLARGARASGAAMAEVAVFFPDRADWLDFRRGIAACQRRGLVKPKEDAGDAFVVLTAKRGRAVRFAWHGVRGIRQTRDEARRLLASHAPPIAFVGSINTVLTAALAEELRYSATAAKGKGERGGAQRPVLLVPWATSVLSVDPERGPGPVALLDIDPGRTFRFCLDNQRQAELVVRCLADHEPNALPERAYIVVDRNDPYSRDLADAFHRAIQTVAPHSEIVEQAEALAPTSASSLADSPSAEERNWADAVWRGAREAGQNAITWVVLPVQSEPAKRLVYALRSRATSSVGEGPLRVVCGDALGLETLLDLAGHRAFPLWCVSPASAPGAGRLPGAEAADDMQIAAEIVASIVHSLDLPGPLPTDLRAALNALDLGPDDPSAFGRGLSFAASGEREGEALGHVLAVHPGRPEVLAYGLGADGKWSAAVPIRPVPVARQP